MSSSYLKRGTQIEISSNDEGFRGAWFAGTVAGPISKDNKVLVEYQTLMSDETGSDPLREKLDVVQLRPPAPRELRRRFKFSEEVDAYHNDGWWEGVITRVNREEDLCTVFFRTTREEMDFGPSDLRLHREWVNGKWVPPLEDQVFFAFTGNVFTM